MRNRQSLVATVLAVIFFCSLLCVGLAIAEPAAPLPDVETDPLGALVLMVQHWQAGAVGVAIAIGLSVIVAFVRRLRVVLPWMGTDRGGAITALGVALCTSVAAALVEGTGITLAVLTSGAMALFLAVGGRQWLRRLLYPADGSGPVWLDWGWLRWMLGAFQRVAQSAGLPTAVQVEEHANRHPITIDGVDEPGGLWRCNSGPGGMPVFAILANGTRDNGESVVYVYDHHCEEWEVLQNGADNLVWRACDRAGAEV